MAGRAAIYFAARDSAAIVTSQQQLTRHRRPARGERTPERRPPVPAARRGAEKATVSRRCPAGNPAHRPGIVRLSEPRPADLRRPGAETAAEPGVRRGNVLPFLLAGPAG